MSTSTANHCRRIRLIDATDNFAVRKYVEIIITPLTGWAVR
jgi:hypothetical protein